MAMDLTKAEEGKEYIIKSIQTDDEELDSFLFSLGCYSGEPITLVSRKQTGYVVSIKDSRYNITQTKICQYFFSKKYINFLK